MPSLSVRCQAPSAALAEEVHHDNEK